MTPEIVPLTDKPADELDDVFNVVEALLVGITCDKYEANDEEDCLNHGTEEPCRYCALLGDWYAAVDRFKASFS